MEIDSDEIRLCRAAPLDTRIGIPDVHHPSPEPNMVEEAVGETIRLLWKDILRLLTPCDPLIHFSTRLRQLQLAMDDPTTSHKILAMRLSEINILKYLGRILLAAHTDIPSTRVETVKQPYITLCNSLGTIPLIGMSYTLVAVLSVVEHSKYWHMTYEANNSQVSSSQTGS